MDDATVKRERPTIPARRFVRKRSTADSVKALDAGLAAQLERERRLVDCIDIPPQSDVRRLSRELLPAESAEWAIDLEEAPAKRQSG
ncbi:MAG TPA: hypothetical protein VHM70_20730 [Polyangiaceae bacterium]|jgi:hypothetical protein|nr:hypothetical protein [Polyangiaceae bacterium]